MITIKIFKWLQSFLRDNWKNFHGISVLLILLFLPFVANDYNQKWKKSLKVTTFRNYTPQNQKNFAFFATTWSSIRFFFRFIFNSFSPQGAAGVRQGWNIPWAETREAATRQQQRRRRDITEEWRDMASEEKKKKRIKEGEWWNGKLRGNWWNKRWDHDRDRDRGFRGSREAGYLVENGEIPGEIGEKNDWTERKFKGKIQGDYSWWHNHKETIKWDTSIDRSRDTPPPPPRRNLGR